jgi:hypothetical protein
MGYLHGGVRPAIRIFAQMVTALAPYAELSQKPGLGRPAGDLTVS